MLSKYRQKKEQGFTIIEVLIVLAIAGLIMLVVFLAIPALQRNSRNNQRTTDVANILGGVGEYVSNNNGQTPTSATLNGSTLTIGTGNSIDVELGYYTQGTGQGVTLTSDSATDNPGNEDLVTIVIGGECGSGEDTGNTVDGASRVYSALYTLENDSNQCRQS
jgi:prepilin-type N-terminal cleavage/methylation domain-containing protein